jgi:hypothetical protein
MRHYCIRPAGLTSRVRNPLGSSLAVVRDHAQEADADWLVHPAAAQMIPAARTAAQAKRAQSQAHKLIVGTYMHRGPGATRLPEAAGHTFVAVEGPRGRREA